MFEVQLLYDINQALDPKSWNGNFHTISLHSSLKHFISDIKSIKESLKRMQKYILNKSIVGDKANDVKDLKGIGKATWEFILALYESKWDYFIANKNNFSFRQKVKAQFNPLLPKNVVSNKGKSTDKAVMVSVLPLPILAKSLKEVVEISKYFKKNSSTNDKKLYAQVSSHNTNIVIILNSKSGIKEQLLYWVTQENLIEIPLQTNLSYILLTMVCAHYCAPYPKWPCVEHEVNMWYPCCMTSFVLEPSTSFSQFHNLCCDYTIRLWLMWQCDQSLLTLTLVVLKIENRKIKLKLKLKLKNKVHFQWS